MSFYPTSDPNKERYEREKHFRESAENSAEYYDYDDDDESYDKDIKRRCGHTESFVKCQDYQDELRQAKLLCYYCEKDMLERIEKDYEYTQEALKDRYEE